MWHIFNKVIFIGNDNLLKSGCSNFVGYKHSIYEKQLRNNAEVSENHALIVNPYPADHDYCRL